MGLTVRPLRRVDREAVAAMLAACSVFTTEEVRVALELLDTGLDQGLAGDYPLFAAEVDGRVHGYVCVGQTLLTLATWHLYWICVHPDAQGRGVGRALQQHAEAFVRSRGGARLVLETSAGPGYARARAFYEGAGYAVVGRIADFYRPGDDCLVYCKRLGAP